MLSPPRCCPAPLLPCRAVIDGGYTGMLEAPGTDVCEWLLSDNFEARIFTFFPCTDITPTVANQASRGRVGRWRAGQGHALGRRDV